MYVRVKDTPNSPRKSIQIVESVRVGSKVKQKIVRYVGIAMDDDELVKLKDLAQEICVKIERDKSDQLSLLEINDSAELKKQGRPKHKRIEDIVPVDKVNLSEVFEESRVIEGVHEVAGKLYDELGFNSIVDGQAGKILKDIVLTRMITSDSKRQSCKILAEGYNKEHDLDKVYRMMDKLKPELGRLKELVRDKTLGLFPRSINVLFYDVTTLYFESKDEDEFRRFGYSKDSKVDCTQVVLALATNEEGLPLGYELFCGNKGESKTLIDFIKELRQLVEIKQVIFVADRGMYSKENIELLDKEGIEYVIGMPLRKVLTAQMKKEVLSPEGYIPIDAGEYLTWGKELTYNGNRLIVVFSPNRAQRDMLVRDKVLEKLQDKLNKGMKNLISNRGYLRYVESGNNQKIKLDEAKIEIDRKWDGIYGLISNAKTMSIREIVYKYRCLWKIEESFRINKHNLKMRPIYHYTKPRIESHIGICYLAYALLKQLYYRIRITQTEMSIEDIRRALLSVQASVLKHRVTGDEYRMPGRMTNDARTIYKAMGLKRSLDAQIYQP